MLNQIDDHADRIEMHEKPAAAGEEKALPNVFFQQQEEISTAAAAATVSSRPQSSKSEKFNTTSVNQVSNAPE